MELKKKNIFSSKNCIFLGLIALLVYYLPYFILGENSYIAIHDNLDDYVIKKILDMRYFFSGSDIIHEVMNGVSKPTGLNMFMNIFYLVFSPFVAYILSDVIVRVAAFLGMYLLLNKLLPYKKYFLHMVISLVFSILPMFTIYGLNYAGIPLLVFCFLLLYEKKYIVPSFVYIFLYVYNSLFVLIGYVIVAFALLYLLYLLFTKNIAKQKWLFCGLIFMILLYIPSALNALSSTEGYISHRSEFNVYSVVPSLKDTLSMWLNGHYHALSLHKIILAYSSVVLLGFVFIIKKIKKETKTIFYLDLALYILTILIAVFYGMISPLIRSLLGETIPMLKSFQYDRFYLLYPPLWYMIFALTTYLVLDTVKGVKEQIVLSGITYICIFVTVVLTLANGYYKYNVLKIAGFDYTTEPSWKQFYDEELFDEIKQYIGEDVSEYKVANLGLHPAVSLYNGLYCLDAYWNDYSLEYKNEFRKIISGELEEDESLKGYFDDWGNRCYLFSSELGRDYVWSKTEDKSVTDLDYNIDAFKKLGGEYIISAVEVENASEIGLSELKTFVTDDSYYKITLYKAN